MNKLNQYIQTLLFAFLVTLFACSPQHPNDVLSPEKMESFMYDFYIAKAFGDDADYSDKYTKSLYVNYVYDKHQITKEEFDYSMSWYSRHLPELVKISENVSKRLTDDKEEIDQLVAWQYDTPMVSVSGDSVDIWAWHQIYRFTGTPLYNNTSFVLPVDTNFRAGDKLEWNIHLNYSNESVLDSTYMAVMQMAMYFKNDSSILKNNLIDSSGFHQIVLQSDSLGDIKEVKGFIYLPPQKEKQRLLIDSVSLYRFHSAEKDTLAIDLPDAEKEKLDSIGVDSVSLEQTKLEPQSIATEELTLDQSR